MGGKCHYLYNLYVELQPLSRRIRVGNWRLEESANLVVMRKVHVRSD